MKSFTLNEVSKHNTESDCWIILFGKVYNITKFIKIHPGQFFPVYIAGKDATDMFKTIHSHRAKQLLSSNTFQKKNLIGYIKDNKRIYCDSSFEKELNIEVSKYLNNLYEKSIVYSKFILFTCTYIYIINLYQH